jgi:hypothetical protein
MGESIIDFQFPCFLHDSDKLIPAFAKPASEKCGSRIKPEGEDMPGLSDSAVLQGYPRGSEQGTGRARLHRPLRRCGWLLPRILERGPPA